MWAILQFLRGAEEDDLFFYQITYHVTVCIEKCVSETVGSSLKLPLVAQWILVPILTLKFLIYFLDILTSKVIYYLQKSYN